MGSEQQVQAVYQAIWDHLVEHETLPSAPTIAHALGMSVSTVHSCIRALRYAGRIRENTFYPVAYDAWWHEQVAARGWTPPELATLEKKKLRRWTKPDAAEEEQEPR